MNNEKRIAQAILDAQKMREESYAIGNGERIGHYKLDIKTCLQETCEAQKLSPNLWCLLNLAMYWWNDVQVWAEDILADKTISLLEESPLNAQRLE